MLHALVWEPQPWPCGLSCSCHALLTKKQRRPFGSAEFKSNPQALLHVDFCRCVRPGTDLQKWKDEGATFSALEKPVRHAHSPAICSLQPLGFQDHLNSLEVPALPLAASHPWGASLSALLRRREESSLILLGFCLTDAGGRGIADVP